jgi:hypothetical protein
MRPFGEVSCEAEKTVLGDVYSDFFFEGAPFNQHSIEPDTFLIIGRRGCGKTSLAEYFKFQSQLPNARCIDVDEPRVFGTVSKKLVELLDYPVETSIPMIADLWEYALWNLIFHLYRDADPRIRAASIVDGEGDSATSIIRDIFNGVLDKYVVNNADKITFQMGSLLNKAAFRSAKEQVLKLAIKRPVIVAIDSMEHYTLRDKASMWSIAGLLECASRFNREHSSRGIHLKLFLTDEIYPHLLDVISNTIKHVRDPLFLHWRPKDLVRLVCWRLYMHLRLNKPEAIIHDGIDWEKFNSVHNKMWKPYFGEKIENRNGIIEYTFPYILRHTQLRPRQLVIICNEIAKRASRAGGFPNFGHDTLKEAIWNCELELANEVFNAYSQIYPSIGNIVLALSGLPMTFKGKELDKVAKRTSAHWDKGDYSPDKFRQIVTETGIVGRQRGDKDARSGIIEADFEFAMEDRLYIHEQDDCVIHPMFYRKLNIVKQAGTCIYPFPDHPDFSNIIDMRRE